MRVRDLYAYVYDCITSCGPLMALVDATDGVRRVKRPKQLDFRSCLCYGSAQGSPIDRHEPEPVQDASVLFRPYVRIDYDPLSSGDLIVGDMIYWLKRRFGCARCENSCCPPVGPLQLIVMNSRYRGELDDCRIYDPLQAWTQTVEFRFRVVYQCCRPGQELYIT